MNTLCFCANLSFMFLEYGDLLLRMEAAKLAGFSAYEVAFPYDASIEDLQKAQSELGISLELINTFPGENGELGFAATPGSEEAFKNSLHMSIAYAKALNCTRIHIMSGKKVAGISDSVMEETYVRNLIYAANMLEPEDMIGLIEPINKYTGPNYFLDDFNKALSILQRVNSSNIKLQLDIFHLQQITGDLTNNIVRLLPYTGHIQIAQVPDRHEPNTFGEIDYKYILQLLEKLQYNRWIGLEYEPIQGTVEGLSWIEGYGYDLISC
ncbi:putative hydroxypyruvate isomerase [Artemia franciscana]|uniref:putative hydroxypyruvate isomerase n=1 Tax=Artemia franciscana TaxID=6661 RepID=UPI0032DB5DD5